MKATDILQEYHEFVELVDDYLDKKKKAEQYRTSLHVHATNIAERAVNTAISIFRMTTGIAKKTKPKPHQGGFNFLAR